jgi:poly-gamma-glutamate capsule biosynthesis protein CapA/YwtB (metallophosphatase superfamily)
MRHLILHHRFCVSDTHYHSIGWRLCAAQVLAYFILIATFVLPHHSMAQRSVQQTAQSSLHAAQPSSHSQCITIRAVGDVLLGSYTPVQYIPPDSGQIFVRSMRRYLAGDVSTGSEADIVFGNFEGTFTRPNDPTMKPQKCSEQSRRRGVCFEFGVPLFLASSLKQMGFTVMSVDNNHADDYGTAAAELTKMTLSSLGIQPAPKRGAAILTIKGKKIAIIAFGFSNTSYNIADTDAASAVVRAAKQQYDRVLVSFHGGAEGKQATHVVSKTEMFYGENRGNVVKFARTCIDAGADMVIGHGPHVLRALELYRGRLIAYSLGNFLTYGNINIKGVSGIACILEATLDAETGAFLVGRVIPTRQQDPGVPVYDATSQALTLLQELMKTDVPSSPLQLDAQGRLTIVR